MLDKKAIHNEDELEFAIFSIENLAVKLKVAPEKLYQALTEQSDILYQYIVPEYEMLHTQGKDYIISDISDVMRERGITL